MNLFHEIVYRPLFNLLVLIYQILPIKDFGLAVIFLTILIRFLFYPLTLKSLRSQKEISDLQKEIAEIIAWNIFQMDGIKYVIPMSCKNKKIIIKGEQTLFEKEDDRIAEKQCVGCEKKTSTKHNGTYVKIMDWVKGEPIKFVDIVN